MIDFVNGYIKTLISTNKDATKNINTLEKTVAEYEISDEKAKANFGNLCIALKGYRMIAEATECLLINENCLKGDDGEFYQKMDVEDKEDEDCMKRQKEV